MLQWLPYPMVRVSLAFIIGIFIGLETNSGHAVLEPCWIGLFGVYGMTLKIIGTGYSKWYPWLATMAFALLVMAGLARSSLSLHQPEEAIGTADYFQATVVIPTEIHGHHYRTTIEISRVWSEGVAWPVNDRAQWYQDSQNPIQLDYGSKLILKGSPSPIIPPENPLEFNFRGYMAQKNIFWHYWADQHSIMMHLSAEKNLVTSWSYGLRNLMRDRLTRYLPPGASQEVSMAMLLGDRSAVSVGLEEYFAQSGTIHVLAVSGLHLGILYGILLRFIGAWRRHFLFKWLFLGISLIVLWTFTLITGMAPSTRRAAAMFTILILANTLSKQNNTLNTLAASALVILWVDPYQLYSVGFQLSFLALCGILFLQPWIMGAWQIKNRLLKYLWELGSVSFSAQLAVLPLSAYYFHQLPVYFLLSNLILVPLAFAIVVSGVVFFLGALFPPLVTLVAVPLIYLTKIAGYVVQVVADLPNSTLQNIQINQYELLIWYGILGSGIVFIKTRHKLSWLICLGLLFGLTFNAVQSQIHSRVRKQIVVYHVRGHTAVDLIAGNQFLSLMDPELVADSSLIDYKINNYRQHLDLKPLNNRDYPDMDVSHLGLWLFQGKRLLLIKSSFRGDIGGKIKLKSHIVVVSNDSVDELEQLTSWVDLKLLIIDGSNGQGRARRLEQQAQQLGLEVHNCWEDGYKIINL